MNKLCFIALFFVLKVSAFEVGAVSISGNGCDRKDSGMPETLREAEYKIPLILVMSKHEASQLERKVCMLSLPVKVGKKEKLQVSNVLQNVTIKAFGGAHAKVALTVSGVGGAESKPLEVELKTPTALEQELKSDGIVFESKCGKDAIVRANLNAFVQGAGTASVSTGELQFSMRAVPCK